MTAAIVYFLLWAALIVVTMRFGCGAHVLGHGHRYRETGGRTDGEITPPREAIDPVCGMVVEPRTSKTSVHDRGVYCSCSRNCRETSQETPPAYTKSGAASPASREDHHGAH